MFPPPNPSVVHPFDSFESASRAVLGYLQQQIGLDLWLVTRNEGEHWLVLFARDEGYGVEDGTLLRWSDSFCSRMVEGRGPQIAPYSSQIPAYATAPIGQQLAIQAYVGVPLRRADGSLFGTLCAIDPEPQAHLGERHLAQVTLLASLLSTLLERELELQESLRRVERAESAALRDELTGLYNRRGWEQLLAREAARCQRYGEPLGIVFADLDGLKQVNDHHGHAAGDALLRGAATTMRTISREVDVVARVGGDEFALLVVGTSDEALLGFTHRLAEGLGDSGIAASLGYASHPPMRSAHDAVARADQMMYEVKQGRKRH